MLYSWGQSLTSSLPNSPNILAPLLLWSAPGTWPSLTCSMWRTEGVGGAGEEQRGPGGSLSQHVSPCGLQIEELAFGGRLAYDSRPAARHGLCCPSLWLSFLENLLLCPLPICVPSYESWDCLIHLNTCIYPNARPQRGLHWRLQGKESACNAGDTGLIPEWEDPLQEKIAMHSSSLAWEIPRTEEPSGLQSTGSQESDVT